MNRAAPSPILFCSNYWKRSFRVTLDLGHKLHLLLLCIYVFPIPFHWYFLSYGIALQRKWAVQQSAFFGGILYRMELPCIRTMSLPVHFLIISLLLGGSFKVPPFSISDSIIIIIIIACFYSNVGRNFFPRIGVTMSCPRYVSLCWYFYCCV